ncbi:MAG: helix-turn-helix transcriptional regulator [Flavobacteriales bacterium]|nr:MAG: helix-turn-helix transcriptional regulator [Flavobacteriales bacterium]
MPDISLHKQIGTRLAALRKARGYPQAVVAAECGLTVSRLSRLENGRAVLLMDEAMRLTLFYGVDLQALSTYPPPRVKSPWANKPMA